MKPLNFIGLLLLIVGLLTMIYGGISYTRKTHEAKLGALTISIQEKQTVYIPIWVGLISMIAGGTVLMIKQKKIT